MDPVANVYAFREDKETVLENFIQAKKVLEKKYEKSTEKLAVLQEKFNQISANSKPLTDQKNEKYFTKSTEWIWHQEEMRKSVKFGTI